MLFQLALSLIAATVTAIWTYIYGGNYWYIYPGGDNQNMALVL